MDHFEYIIYVLSQLLLIGLYSIVVLILFSVAGVILAAITITIRDRIKGKETE